MRLIKQRRIRRTARGRNEKQVVSLHIILFFGKLTGKVQLRKLKSERESNNKMVLRETCCADVHRIHEVRDRDQ